jgi:hypothetical protein
MSHPCSTRSDCGLLYSGCGVDNSGCIDITAALRINGKLRPVRRKHEIINGNAAVTNIEND